MKNAHLRMGTLHLSYVTTKRTTQLSVLLDRMILEPNEDRQEPGRLHLMSVVGSDAEISAINAALAKDSNFRIEALGENFYVSMGAKPDCFRGNIAVEGRSRPLRHLLAISAEFTDAAIISNPPKVYLLDSSPQFIWTSLAYIYGLPGRPEWAAWFCRRLQEQGAFTPLQGIGCDPVTITGERDLFLGWLGEGRRSGELDFPPANGPIVWPEIKLTDVLMPPANSPSESTVS